MLMRTRRQNIQLELALEPVAKGEARNPDTQGTEARTAHAEPERPATGQQPLMEAVVEPGNLKKALARVRRNRGAPGVDGMTVDELGDHLKVHWPEIRSRLLAGSYAPQPVRRVEIPKVSGGVRRLGVPTVLDRFIQQAVMQVLQEEWDPRLLGCELRVPARTLGPSGGQARAGAHPRGLRHRRRPRPGEVLRPGQSRHPDGGNFLARRLKLTVNASQERRWTARRRGPSWPSASRPDQRPSGLSRRRRSAGSSCGFGN